MATNERVKVVVPMLWSDFLIAALQSKLLSAYNTCPANDVAETQ